MDIKASENTYEKHSKFACFVCRNVFECLIHYVDVGVDLLLCYEYYTSQNRANFLLTLLLILMPNVLIFLCSSVFKLAETSSEKSWIGIGQPEAGFLMKQMLFLLACSMLNLFILLG